MKQKFAVLISYDGTDYCGWQKQRGSAAAGGPSIQETFEKAISKVSSEEVSIVGSGRTDAGVHALGQVAHFILTRKEWPLENLFKGLNSLLPKSIRVQGIEKVSDDFNAQRSALKKQYGFYVQQGFAEIPHLAPYSWWIRHRLNVDAMSEALQALVGEHEFKPFQASGAAPGPTKRTILEAEVVREEIGFPSVLKTPVPGGSHLLKIRVVGTGFLKQMVRAIAGTLMEVGSGKLEKSVFSEVLKTQNRELLGVTAQPRGLWLERVWYPELEFRKPFDRV